jgi:hypothetical protein
MRDWGRVLIRSFGIANWLFGLIGACFLIGTQWIVHVRHLWPDRYDARAHYFLITTNALFVLATFLTGYWLILVHKRGVVFSNCLFSAEILFFVLSAIVDRSLDASGNATAVSVGRSLGAMDGVGNMGIAPQILTAYPVIALIVLNLARKRLDSPAFLERPSTLSLGRLPVCTPFVRTGKPLCSRIIRQVVA